MVKERILERRKMLSNMPISVNEDCNEEIRNRRKELTLTMKATRKNGHYTKIIGGQLNVNGVRFSVEQCLAELRDPVIDSEKSERNRTILREKIRNILGKGNTRDEKNWLAICDDESSIAKQSTNGERGSTCRLDSMTSGRDDAIAVSAKVMMNKNWKQLIPVDLRTSGEMSDGALPTTLKQRATRDGTAEVVQVMVGPTIEGCRVGAVENR